MSIAVLLVPGDLIEKIKSELVERQIQIDLVDWRKQGDSENAETDASTRKEPNGSGLGKETDGDKKAEAPNEKGESQGGERGSKEKETDLSRKDTGGGGEVGTRPNALGAKNGKPGDGAEGDGGRRMVVLAEGIARKIKQKYNTELGVYPDEGVVLYFEKHVQNELGFDKELTAQQHEAYKILQKKKDRNVSIDKVMSMKKLIDLVGGKDVQEKPISARQSGVRLVSNNIKHVNYATAYFTAPTGDVNWKEVARQAARNSNIMAYHSEGEDVAKDLIHLIDHL
uniref:VP6 n=1 Tax=Changuinola virus TaxID=40052 RepID=A0A3Q8AY56_9REOV|nr:VP6 [Changuinola virus]